MNGIIKFTIAAAFFILILNLALNAQEDQISVAKRFVHYLSRYDHDKALLLVAEEKKHVITSELLSFYWKIIIKERGDFKNIDGAKQDIYKDEKGKVYKAVYVSCIFTNDKGILIIIFNDKDKISGLAYTTKRGETISFALIN